MSRRYPYLHRFLLAAAVCLGVLAAAVPAAAQALIPFYAPVSVSSRPAFPLDLAFGALGTSLLAYEDDDFQPDAYTQASTERAIPVGPEEALRGGGPGLVDNASVAPLADGTFLVVFAVYQTPSGGYTTGNQMARFAVDGTRIGPNQPVEPASGEPGFVAPGQVIPLPDGGWRVFWYEEPYSTSIAGAYYTRRYAANGDAVPGSTRELGPVAFLDVDTNAAGQAVGVERGLVDGEPWILARRLDTNADPVGSVIEIAPVPSEGAAAATRVAVAPDGSFLVVWQAGPFVRGRILGADDQPSGDERSFEPAGYVRTVTPSVDAMPDHTFVVALHASGSGDPLLEHTFLYLLSPTGFALGRRPLGDVSAPGPVVAAREDGVIRVAWRRPVLNPNSPAEPLIEAQDIITRCAGPSAICLQNGRFKVQVEWDAVDAQGNTSHGLGTPRPLTPESTAFWFFREENLELFVKVLDACEEYDRYWVFLAGLTNVEVDITVTDTVTGQVRTYHNEQKTPFEPIYDTQAFDTCGRGQS